MVRRKVTKKIIDHLMVKDTKHTDRHKSKKLNISEKPVAKKGRPKLKGQDHGLIMVYVVTQNQNMLSQLNKNKLLKVVLV